ncbi:hypothetical protein SCP_0802290 [Sparassis crispa]|uniref:Uncharacterized protein n=1 Tax=Sparassis crispa TaxID=139825 RepID=A0A401GU19_9APHY|nr:hypothetical protein SCP_0802290 [Sparassis crispa]GBE85707.1 hypothetical protein SCP_0802290 [Sparassis crispa]
MYELNTDAAPDVSRQYLGYCLLRPVIQECTSPSRHRGPEAYRIASTVARYIPYLLIRPAADLLQIQSFMHLTVNASCTFSNLTRFPKV